MSEGAVLLQPPGPEAREAQGLRWDGCARSAGACGAACWACLLPCSPTLARTPTLCRHGAFYLRELELPAEAEADGHGELAEHRWVR